MVNQALVRQAGGLPDCIVLVNANGRRVPAEIAGVVDSPLLDLYKTMREPLIFLPYQRGPVFPTNILLRSEDDIERAIHEIEPRDQDGDSGLLQAHS